MVAPLELPFDTVHDAPEAGTAVYVTVTPGMELPAASRTTATSGAAYCVLSGASCGSVVLPPFTYVIDAGGPTFVRVNVAGEETPPTVALTVYVPGVTFAVAVNVAIPAALVVALPVPRVAVAPPEGTAVKETVLPDTGVPFASVTSTASGFANTVLTEVNWLSPE